MVLDYVKRQLAVSFEISFKDASGNVSINTFTSFVDECIGFKKGNARASSSNATATVVNAMSNMTLG